MTGVTGVTGNSLPPKSSVTAVTAVTFSLAIKGYQRSRIGVFLRVEDALGLHELGMLRQVLAERRDGQAPDVGLRHQRPGRAFPMTALMGEGNDIQHARRNLGFGQLLERSVLDLHPAVFPKAQFQFSLLDVSTGDAECGIGRVPVPCQHPGEVRGTGDGVRAGNRVHYVGVAHLSGVVDNQDGYAVGIGEALQLGHVPIVRRVAVVTRRRPDHLQRIDDDEAQIGMGFVELSQLVKQAR